MIDTMALTSKLTVSLENENYLMQQQPNTVKNNVRTINTGEIVSMAPDTNQIDGSKVLDYIKIDK